MTAPSVLCQHGTASARAGVSLELAGLPLGTLSGLVMGGASPETGNSEGAEAVEAAVQFSLTLERNAWDGGSPLPSPLATF